MKRLWHDIRTHHRAAVLFLVYWLAALGLVVGVWFDTTQGAAVVLAAPLIAGALVGHWRAAAHASHRIGAGMLAGAVCGGITILAMTAHDVINWIQRGHQSGKLRLDEALEFFIFFVIAGSLLGLAGAVLATILDRFRRHGRPAPSF